MTKIGLAKPDITKREKELVRLVLDSGRLSMGPMTDQIEDMFCEYLDRRYAIACSSGTMGLWACFEAIKRMLDLKEPTVGISYETFGATMNAAAFASYDIKVANKNEVVDVYCPCHVFGVAAPEMDSMVEQMPKFRMMVEDACEALGGTWQGNRLGSVGDAAVFGFYPNKQIAMGEGGMIVTNHPDMADMIRKLVNQGRLPGEPHTILGLNCRITEMQAALGVAQMERIDDILAKRRKVADWYNIRLDDYKPLAELGVVIPANRTSWFAYPLLFSACMYHDWNMLHSLHDYLDKMEIGNAIYFPRHNSFPEFTWERNLCLPFYNTMTESEVETVCHAVKTWTQDIVK